MNHQRRQLLHWFATGAAGFYVPQSRAQISLATRQDPFALGVASGSPTDASVVLWTRLVLTPEQASTLPAVAVRWEVADDEAFLRPVQSGTVMATAALAHSVHVELNNLAADRWYFYRFKVGNAVSSTGRTRTFAAPDARVSQLRLGYASCQRWEHGYYSAYRHMQAENLDALLFLGDYIYEYPTARNAVRVPTGGWVTTLDDYRQRYALHKSDTDLQAMHAVCPWLVTWDDHEVQNDYAGHAAGDSGLAVLDFAARRAAAYQAFYEHMPLPAAALTRALAGLTDPSGAAELRIYSSVPIGRLANIYMLDTRQYKDPQVCSAGGKTGASKLNPQTCPEWHNPARSLLGLQQERWLEAQWGQTGSRDGRWNVVGQSTLFGPRDFKPGTGQMLWNDGWDGYSAARTRLVDSLRKNAVSNPVLLGGDVHENWVGHIKADYSDPSSKTVGVEFCGTSITSRSAGNAKIAGYLAENPHFVFADSERKGYGLIHLTPERLTTTLRVVSDVTQKSASVQTLAQFSVAAGQAVIERI